MGLFDIFNNAKKEVEKRNNLYGNSGGCIKRNNQSLLDEDRYFRNETFNPYFEEGFVMEIEDIFTITGRGTVVVGKIMAGDLRINDRVKIQRNGTIVMEVDVIGIEMFRKTLNYAKVGDSIGVLLKGVNKNDLKRGDKLIK